MLFSYRQQNSFFTAIFLACCLLWSQAYLLQHELDHQINAQDSAELCQTCGTVSKDKQGLIPATMPSFFVVHSILLFPILFTTAWVVINRYFSPQTRAPPIVAA